MDVRTRKELYKEWDLKKDKDTDEWVNVKNLKEEIEKQMKEWFCECEYDECISGELLKDRLL